MPKKVTKTTASNAAASTAGKKSASKTASRPADAFGDDWVDFGFDKVSADQKTTKVEGLFSDVSGSYDLMNDLMSFGSHRIWKEYLIDRVNCSPVGHLLDLAGGTGDIAFRFLSRRRAGRVTVCDLTFDMLAKGMSREENLMYPGRADWVTANGEQLPFADKTFDALTISFGLRNVTRPQVLLKEARRVLKDSGRFFCLEFSQIENPIFEKIYKRYSFDIVPRIGKAVAGNAGAYRYLVESIDRFADADKLSGWLDEAGFKSVEVQKLSGGIVALHAARAA